MQLQERVNLLYLEFSDIFLSIFSGGLGGKCHQATVQRKGRGVYPLSGAIPPCTAPDNEFGEMSNSLLSRTTSIRGRFAEKEQQEGFAVKRKNLPPMMQEREKDWSRRLVFALFELLLLQ